MATNEPKSDEEDRTSGFDANRFGNFRLSTTFFKWAISTPLPKEREEDLWRDTLPPKLVGKTEIGLVSESDVKTKPGEKPGPDSKLNKAAALKNAAVLDTVGSGQKLKLSGWGVLGAVALLLVGGAISYVLFRGEDDAERNVSAPQVIVQSKGVVEERDDMGEGEPRVVGSRDAHHGDKTAAAPPIENSPEAKGRPSPEGSPTGQSALQDQQPPLASRSAQKPGYPPRPKQTQPAAEPLDPFAPKK